MSDVDVLAEIGIGISHLCQLTNGSLNIRLQKENTAFAKKGWKLSIGDNYAKNESLVDAINELIAIMEDK